MDFEIPTNVTIHKQKEPIGLSYPFKTSEIVTALDLENLKQPFRIFYMNNKPDITRPRNQKRVIGPNFNLFSISWYEEHFFMGVHIIRPQYRPVLHKIIVADVFPIVRSWLTSAYKLLYINSLSLDCYTIEFSPHKWGTGVELKENKDRRLFIKEIDLEKKNDKSDKGPVLEA